MKNASQIGNAPRQTANTVAQSHGWGNMRSVGYWLIAPVVLAVLCGCAKNGEEASPYPILDSGFPASINDRLYWLDNDRVIFVSYGAKPNSLEEAEKHPRVPSINIWDTRTNKVLLYKNSAKGLCADGTYIQYAIAKVPYDPEYQPQWYAGPISRERKIPLPPGRLDNRVVLNPYTCHWVEKPEYAKGKQAENIHTNHYSWTIRRGCCHWH